MTANRLYCQSMCWVILNFFGYFNYFGLKVPFIIILFSNTVQLQYKKIMYRYIKKNDYIL